MSEELAITEPKPISITAGASLSEVIKRAALINQVLKQVMQRGQHYGTIPGVEKDVLLKPGAEKLCSLFNLGSELDIQQIDLPEGHREYLVKCTIKHYPTGATVGQGVGSCSTMESKYRYRNTADYEVTDEDIPADAKERKQEYRKQGFGMKKVNGQWAWVKYGDEAKTENPDLADVYNTVLKMSKKRALIDAVLTATGASDIFTQDVEERADKPERSSLVREKVIVPEGRKYNVPEGDEEKVYRVPKKDPVEPEAEREDVSYVWTVSILDVPEPEQIGKHTVYSIMIDDLEHPMVKTTQKHLATRAAQWIEDEPVEITVTKTRKGGWELIGIPEPPEGPGLIDGGVTV